MAATAFTALVDALWISLFALRPGNGLPTTSLVLGLVGLTSAIGLTVRLWRARTTQELTRRWPFLLGVTAGLYAYQVSTAFTARAPQQAQSTAATLVFIFFGGRPGTCLGTAWPARRRAARHAGHPGSPDGARPAAPGSQRRAGAELRSVTGRGDEKLADLPSATSA